MKQVVILGATGSVGASTLDVLARHPEAFNVLGLSAHTRIEELLALVTRFQPQYVAVQSQRDADLVRQYLGEQSTSVIIFTGPEGLCQLAALDEATHIVAGIVGAAGLPSCLAAAEHGKTILLANKEALVMAGQFFMETVREHGATLLPLDSEHNALFQTFPKGHGASNTTVKHVWLTASGGPFLDKSAAQLDAVTPEQACKHPTWSMGKKISVDSATLMNKGLEVIEAALMYQLPPAAIKVVIHPQSTLHALVQYIDGTLLAHLSHPDMRVPIAHALAYPDRFESGVDTLDMCSLGQLNFSAPDLSRFPCLGFAYRALTIGQRACIAVNAGNEIAVQAFLDGQIKFTHIPSVIEHALQACEAVKEPSDLSEVFTMDSYFRQVASNYLLNLKSSI